MAKIKRNSKIIYVFMSFCVIRAWAHSTPAGFFPGGVLQYLDDIEISMLGLINFTRAPRNVVLGGPWPPTSQT